MGYDLLLLTLKHRQSWVSWLFECCVYSQADGVIAHKFRIKISQWRSKTRGASSFNAKMTEEFHHLSYDKDVYYVNTMNIL